MRPSVSLYVHHTPTERLEVEVLGVAPGGGWIHVRPPEPDRGAFSLGLSAGQARDLARRLFGAAGQLDAQEAEAAAIQPEVAPA